MDRARVTAAEIARLAGVGRAAVSNWRKRYESFPDPVGGTAASPQFDLDAVERWLVEQDKLPAVADEDRLWRNLVAAAGAPADALAAVGDHLLGRAPLPYPELARELSLSGDRPAAFDALWRRFADSAAQRAVTTPDELADLMVRLAGIGHGSTALDPACGTGRLLRAAVQAGAAEVFGQDNDAAAARLADRWLAVNDVPGQIRVGDSLRADAFGAVAVDAVIANPPFGLTNWGHEDLGYDRRWEFGVPPRTEPELAWAQHAFAHLRPGGRAVLLMPPSAASRRAGRRIRAELLRRGVLRAIIALPAGAAAPHAIGLHLWILQRTAAAMSTVMFVDAASQPLDAAYRTILRAVVEGDPDESGYHASVIDLLDEEVDLTPGRHGPADSGGAEASAAFQRSREELVATVDSLPGLLPAATISATAEGPLPTVSVGDLVRSGLVQVLGPVRAAAVDTAAGSNRPVLTSDDVVHQRSATGSADSSANPGVDVLAGDVVVAAAPDGLAVHIVTDDGSVLGRGVQLLRCNPEALDPWFLAGYLRTSANRRQATSSSGSMRFDVRRAHLPRVPLAAQRLHGGLFRQVQELDDVFRAARARTGELLRHAADGLSAGTLTVDDPGEDDDRRGAGGRDETGETGVGARAR